MKTASITQAKSELSALIDLVRAGERVTILDRGIPVARLEPIAADPQQTGRLQRLERAGLVRLGAAAPPLELMRKAPPRLVGKRDAVAVLLEERALDR